MARQDPSVWPSGVSAITLFVRDLDESKDFYRRAFALPVMYEDESSAVFDLGSTLVNLLIETEAPDLVSPEPVADAGGGCRAQYTITVDDVDARCVELAAAGVDLLNGPVDRPWGIRTAAFRDPSGHVWEIAH